MKAVLQDVGYTHTKRIGKRRKASEISGKRLIRSAVSVKSFLGKKKSRFQPNTDRETTGLASRIKEHSTYFLPYLKKRKRESIVRTATTTPIAQRAYAHVPA